EDPKRNRFGACIKVFGIGGAGGNAVNSMIHDSDIDAVDFIVGNTDAQALENSPAMNKIQLGAKITKGLGAGANPDIGRRAAEEDLDEIMRHVMEADILFLTAGFGGGTGSGALPVIATAAKEMGVLTVAVVTKPFAFEGRRRLKHAEEAIKHLEGIVDTLIVVPNQRLLEIVDEKISMLDAFALSNNILKQAIKGISDIITKSGHINVDFADVKTIMKGMGMALMGTGRASGQTRAKDAAMKAISSPLLENVSVKGARGVLINITGNTDLGLYEINEAASLVYDMVSPDAEIILGSVIDPSIGDDVMVTVIATGVGSDKAAVANAPSYTAAAPVREVILAREAVVVPAQIREVSVLKVEEPIVQHARASEEKVEKILSVEQSDYDMNDLDTPAFMRKKHEQHRTEERSFEQ
ncbi:cell division protein FtsZ, partial [Candidatus Dependentiae bacterium]|nr:cell division protein FtsZ [Candidatus Dependentiae bacterium]